VRLPDATDGAPLVGWEPHLGADVLAVRDGAGGSLQLFFHGDGAARELVAATRVDAAGAPLWRTSYEDFESTASQRLPRTIRFAEGRGSFDDGVEIKFKDRALGDAPPPAAFTLVPPPGVAVREVGCGTRP
jgi:hypothetical protein